MLKLNQISLRRGRKLLMHNVSFQVDRGQRMGVIGANGSGKSSLFAMLLGELEPDEGELILNPSQVMAHVAQQSPSGTRSALDYVLDGDQELRRLQAGIRAVEQGGRDETALHGLYERMESIAGFSADARAAKLLHGLGFAGDSINQPVGEFSGGWRMRLNLAQALMCRSDILLLDEPTNHLDLPGILWLEQWLQRYEGIALVISHDRDFLDQVCTRIAHIQRQQISSFNGNYSQFEAQRAEQLAQQQALYARQQKQIKHIQGYVDRFRYKSSKARQAQSRLKMLERMKVIAPAHVDSPFRFAFLAPDKQPHHLLGLVGAELGYGDSDQGRVLTDVTVNLAAGDRIGLLGVNGAGKSTLVKALADGSTLLSGERIASRDTRVGYFAQHQLDLLDLRRSALQHLALRAPDDREADMRKYLGRFGFSEEQVFEPVAPFSGGEKARLVLALMIRSRPNLLLLDEPTNHLDLEMRQALSMALIQYSGALVVISHDRYLLRSVCDELLIIHNGSVERFTHALDDYPAWLRDHQVNGAAVDDGAADGPAPRQLNRKELRRQQARRRRRLQPLTEAVRRVEQQLAARRAQLDGLEQRLTEQALYAVPERQAELTQLIKDQAHLRAEIDTLEGQWLQASEALEAAT